MAGKAQPRPPQTTEQGRATMSTDNHGNDQENLFKRPVPDPLYAPDTEGPTEQGDEEQDAEAIEVARAAVEKAKTEAVINHYRV
jgi:hypothetical protein